MRLLTHNRTQYQEPTTAYYTAQHDDIKAKFAPGAPLPMYAALNFVVTSFHHETHDQRNSARDIVYWNAIEEHEYRQSTRVENIPKLFPTNKQADLTRGVTEFNRVKYDILQTVLPSYKGYVVCVVDPLTVVDDSASFFFILL